MVHLAHKMRAPEDGGGMVSDRVRSAAAHGDLCGQEARRSHGGADAVPAQPHAPHTASGERKRKTFVIDFNFSMIDRMWSAQLR